MPNDRVDAALILIASIAGDDDRKRTEVDLGKFNLAQIDSSLSIGGFRGPFKSEPETFRRNLVRAVVLTKLSKGSVQMAQAAQQIATLMGKNTAQLQRELLSLFPYKAYRGNFEKRSAWMPAMFTDPTKHAMSKYMYIVHTLQRDPSKIAEYSMNNSAELEIMNKLQVKYGAYAKVTKNPAKDILQVDFLKQYLENPDIIQGNIISSSIISDQKHATYYPIGFIMQVPAECIYVTSPSDVGVTNRTSDIMGELQRVGGKTNNSILSPQEVLAQTKGVGGELGYNEIVVVGTSPEGKQVKVTGLFVKVDSQDNLYAYTGTATKAKLATYVDEPTRKLLADCSKKHNLPIVPIRDTTSQLSNEPWPFAQTDELALRQQLASMTRTRTNTI